MIENEIPSPSSDEKMKQKYRPDISNIIFVNQVWTVQKWIFKKCNELYQGQISVLSELISFQTINRKISILEHTIRIYNNS